MSQIPSKSDFTKQILSKSDNLKGGGGGGGMVMRMKGGFRWGELSILKKIQESQTLSYNEFTKQISSESNNGKMFKIGGEIGDGLAKKKRQIWDLLTFFLRGI